jgi:hypothetical protein
MGHVPCNGPGYVVYNHAMQPLTSRHSHPSVLRYALLLAVPGFLLAAAHPISQTRSGTGLSDLAASVQRAVNSADDGRMRELTTSGVTNDYAWVREWRSSDSRRPWKAGLLRLPGTAGTCLLHVSRDQLCQSTSDHLYEVTGSTRWRLGREIPETELVGARVTDHRLTVTFDRTTRTVHINDRAEYDVHASKWPCALFRLNDYFEVADVSVDGKKVPFERAGGFLAISRPTSGTSAVTAAYTASLPATGETFITESEAALTSYWYLHTGRLPATSRITVVTPQDWYGIGPGHRTAEQVEGARRVARWSNTIPVSYLTVAAGKYTRTTRDIDGIQVEAWLLRHTPERARTIIEEAASAIRFYSQRFSTFPYNRYAVVESQVFPPGLEAYSFTLVGSGNLPGVIAHEVSHTWWGGLVPNTYTRSMWNEAFATYSETLLRRLSSSERAQAPGTGAVGAAATLPKDLPLDKVTDAMKPTHAAIGYGKGALVLEQLERMVGLPKMLRSMKAFVERHHRGDAADWADFQAAVASVCGPEWAHCLDAWITQPGVPTFRLSSVRVKTASEGWEAAGVIECSPPGYWALVPVSVTGNSGSAGTSVLVQGEHTPFSLACRTRPEVLAVDPDGLVLRTPETIKADLTALQEGR